VLGFDACLMGAAEVVSALGKYADVFVGSQELVPGHGWDYTALAVLVEQPTSTPEQLARSLADGFLAQVRQPSRPHHAPSSYMETQQQRADVAAWGFHESQLR
jgi:hypothetical protein